MDRCEATELASKLLRASQLNTERAAVPAFQQATLEDWETAMAWAWRVERVERFLALVPTLVHGEEIEEAWKDLYRDRTTGAGRQDWIDAKRAAMRAALAPPPPPPPPRTNLSAVEAAAALGAGAIGLGKHLVRAKGGRVYMHVPSQGFFRAKRLRISTGAAEAPCDHCGHLKDPALSALHVENFMCGSLLLIDRIAADAAMAIELGNVAEPGITLSLDLRNDGDRDLTVDACVIGEYLPRAPWAIAG